MLSEYRWGRSPTSAAPAAASRRSAWLAMGARWGAAARRLAPIDRIGPRLVAEGESIDCYVEPHIVETESGKLVAMIRYQGDDLLKWYRIGYR